MKLAITAATAAAALIATALIGPVATAAPTAPAPTTPAPPTVAPQAPAPAAQAPVKKSFSYFATFTSRQVVSYGNPKGIGNLTITEGTITDGADAKAGTLTTVMRVVAPSPKKDAELRDTQSQIQLKDGQIFAQAVNEDPKGKPPVSLHIMPVTGGTGAYASARGTLLIRKVGNRYLMAYDLFIDKDLKTTPLTFSNIVTATAAGTAAQGIGNVALTRATGGANSYVSVATRAGATRGAVTDAIDLQIYTATGSLFARTIARSKGGAARNQVFAVLGGTGSYAGHRGELTLSANGRSITAKLAAPGGSSKPLNWIETLGPVTSVAIPGGTFRAAQGEMFADPARKKSLGAYFASETTYDVIDGVTPVVTMLEQEFATGTMIVTGISVATGTAALRPIVGGSGDYGGAAGQVSSEEMPSGLWKKSARFWR